MMQNFCRKGVNMNSDIISDIISLDNLKNMHLDDIVTLYRNGYSIKENKYTRTLQECTTIELTSNKDLVRPDDIIKLTAIIQPPGTYTVTFKKGQTLIGTMTSDPSGIAILYYDAYQIVFGGKYDIIASVDNCLSNIKTIYIDSRDLVEFWKAALIGIGTWITIEWIWETIHKKKK